MGKKRVVSQTIEEVLEEKEKVESAFKKVKEKGIGKKASQVRVYINATYNNTMITVTDLKGNVICWATSGSLGFKGPKKATPFAASKVAEAICQKLKKNFPEKAYVFVKGIGAGRDSALRSLAASGLNIVYIKDVTPIPHNGPRPPKVRRV
ncbi:MAG TPA: 30S ribosomal protein S11 [bacterium]|nr:30S ribosomal protein S11 [bacterium]